MAVLTVTTKGQVTFRKELLKHLGVGPGDKLEVDVLPGARVELHAVQSKEGWDKLSGLLAGKTTKVASLEELTDAAERGWAGLL